jgi:Uma2 family endonuclease
MSGSLVKPHITYDELCKIPADGKRYELFGGEAHVTPSPNLRHQVILSRLNRLFEDAITDRSMVLFAPMDVVLAEATAVQPDLILVLERNSSILMDVVRGVPDLVVEVLSPSTEKMDRGLKMETYARHGIGEYWIVDIPQSVIEIYRLDRVAMAYRLVETCREADRASTPLLPGLSIQTGKLFAK